MIYARSWEFIIWVCIGMCSTGVIAVAGSDSNTIISNYAWFAFYLFAVWYFMRYRRMNII